MNTVPPINDVPIIAIRPAGVLMVSIGSDGTIEYGEDYTPDAAARLLWEAVAEQGLLAHRVTPREISDAAWCEIRNRLLTKVREGCWCQNTAKPCPLHDAYDDGLLDLIQTLEVEGVVKVALP